MLPSSTSGLTPAAIPPADHPGDLDRFQALALKGIRAWPLTASEITRCSPALVMQLVEQPGIGFGCGQETLIPPADNVRKQACRLKSLSVGPGTAPRENTDLAHSFIAHLQGM